MNRFDLETTEDGNLRIHRYGMVLTRPEVAELVERLTAWLSTPEADAPTLPERRAGTAGREWILSEIFLDSISSPR